MRRGAPPIAAALLLLAGARHVAAQSTFNISAAPSSIPSAAVQSATLISGTAVGAATVTGTRVLTVPSYTFQSVYPSESAKALEGSIPSYSYNLTMENNNTRTAICNQQTTYCTTAGCAEPSANVSTNFCNPQTMGWNCKCSSGDSRLLSYEAPVNLFDCRLRNSACLVACQNPNATPRVDSISQCQNACNTLIGQTCGQSNQINVNYQVDSPSQTPSYAGDTLGGGSATRSAAAVVGAGTLLSAALGALVVLLHASAAA